MEWYERFGVATAALEDAFSSAWDLIHSPAKDDPNAQKDLLGLLIRIPVGIGNGVFQSAAAPVQGLLEGYNALTQPVNDAIHRVGATPFLAANLMSSPTWQVQERTATGDSFGSSTVLDPATWGKAWDLAEKTSISQALAFNGHTLLDGLIGAGTVMNGSQIDVLNQVEVAKLKDDPMFNAITGLGDAAVSWYSDPLAGGLKAVGAAKRVSNEFGAGSNLNDPWLERILFNRTNLGSKKTNPNADPDVLSRSKAVDELLHWAQGKPAWQVKLHPTIQAMSQTDDGAGIISTLIGRDGVGDIDTARKVIAVGYGSRAARDELLARNDDLAMQLDNIQNRQNPAFLQALAARDPSLVYTDAYLQQLQKYQDDLAKGNFRNPPSPRYVQPKNQLAKDEVVQTALQKAITAAVGEHAEASGILGSMVKQAPKIGQSTQADRLIAYETNSFSQWNEMTFPKPFAPAIKVITWPGFKLAHSFSDKRPPSWIDPNRKDASSGLWAYMKTSKAFPDDVIQEYSNEYLEALDISSRRTVIEKIEEDAIVRLALKRGIDMNTALSIAKEGIGRKNSLIQKARQSQSQGKVFGVTDDDGNVIRLAAFETQEVNSVPLADLEAYDRIFRTHTGMIKALGWAGKSSRSGWQVSSELFDAFSSAWSAVNLLRPGYTVRNITDDTLRSLASLGALNLVGQISAGVKNGLGNTPLHLSNAGKRTMMLADAVGSVRKGGTRQQIADRIRGRVDQMGRDLHSLKTQTNEGIVIDGHKYRGAYEKRGGSYERVVGSDFTAISGTTGALLGRLRKDFEAEGVVAPNDPGHLSSWVHHVKNTIGQSEIGRRFLEGMTPVEVKTWLKTTAAGRASLRKLGKHGEDIDELVGRSQAVIDQYVPLMRNLPDPFMLRKMALNDELDEKTLEKLFPDSDLRPHVHGPTIAVNLSVGPISDAFHDIIDKGFKFFGSMPTDKLVRHPTFRSMYVGNIRMLHNNFMRQVKGDVTRLTDRDFSQIEHAAREMSLKQLNRLLFDGSTKSNIAHRLRFMTGFFSAWEDSVTKWARIAYDKPETIVNAMKLWNAPNQMNLGSTADPMDPNKRIPRWQVLKLDEETGEWKSAGKDWDPWNINDPNVVIQARIPEFARKWIPFATEDDGTITIAKSSLNLSLQGDAWWLPGAGPLTNMVVSKYVEDHPTTLPDVYKWAIPYGGESNLVYGLLPAWSRRIWQGNESITDGTRLQTYINILQTQTMKIKLGKRAKPSSEAVFMKEIEDRTDQFFKLRAFTSFFSPVAVQYNSPFKFYIDQMRALKAQESNIDVQKEAAQRMADPGHYVPVSADEQFLENYGEDFYGFVTSISKNNLGMPASAEAWDRTHTAEAQKYIDAGQPEKAALLLGQITDTKFNQYVYDAQFHQTIGGPDSSKTARERQSPEEAIAANKVSLGWTKYTQMMDLLDGMQFDQGMDPDFVDFVRTKVARSLAIDSDDEGRPTLNAWGKDFYQTDPEKVPTTIRNMTNFIKDNQELALARPDLRALSVYLGERQRLQKVLQERYMAGGDSTLKARSNADLAQKWKNFQVGQAESNTVFGRIFWRYLSNDRLQIGAVEKMK